MNQISRAFALVSLDKSNRNTYECVIHEFDMEEAEHLQDNTKMKGFK